MNIFARELRQNLKVFLIYCAALLALVAATVAKTSTLIEDGGNGMNILLSAMPAPIRNLFGLGVVDMSQPIGIMSVVMLFVALILCMHASNLGSSTFAREERDRTFEFLYVRGRARPAILGAKALAGVTLIAGLNLAAMAMCWAAIRLQGGAAGALPSMGTAMIVMQAVFYAAGLTASFVTRNMKAANSAAAAVVMVMFLLGIMIAMAPDLKALTALTPFGAFDFKRMVAGGLDLASLCAWLVIATALTAAAFALHNRRDLHT